MAKSGINFEQSYYMGGSSGAVCAPSRGCMLTGRSVFEMTGSYGQTIPDSLITLPQYLKQSGYFTWMTGKWHNEYPAFVRSFSGGASIFFKGMADQYGYLVNDFRTDGAYSPENGRIIKGVHATDQFANEAIRFIKNYNKAEPFFAYVAFKTPHDPRTVAPPYQNLYKAEDIKLPPNFLKEHPFDNGSIRIRDEKLAALPRDSMEVKKHIADYYAMITHIDKRIGDILHTLKERGLDKNTLIIFSSDNGLGVGQHGLLGKQNLYEHSIGVPLIFSGPGIKPGRSSRALVYISDIFPTLCNYLNIPISGKSEMIGESLLPVLQGKKYSGRRSEYYIYSKFQRALRMESYKLIEYLVEGQRHTQLFNLKSDPWEQHNLAENKTFNNKLKEMRAEMKMWHHKSKDPMPLFY